MNKSYDPFEAELAALRPHDASPELRRRIADHQAQPTSVASRWRWRLALTGGLAAACLAAVFLRWAGGQRDEPKSIDLGHKSPLVEVDDSAPTLLAYQRALARSPEELDVLLAKHALVAPEPNPELVRLCAFTRSDTTLHALLGDD